MKNNVNYQNDYQESKKIFFTIPQLLISFLVVAIVSVLLCLGVVNNFNFGGSKSVTTINSKTSTSSSSTTSSNIPQRLLDELSDSYALIKRYYNGDIDEEKLIDSALAGFVSGLGDKYTSYMNSTEMQSLTESTEGEFEGIGVEIEVYNDYVRVVSPVDNSPAYKAGLMSGDIIIAVDGVDIKGLSTTETSKKVRGKKGTSVTLTIDRSGSKFDVTIIRDTIPVVTVTGKMNGTIGVVRISSFAKNTYDELVTTITELRSQGAKSFVLDVRSNPGGLLDSVEKVLNVFLENGQVMFQMQDNSNTQTYKASSEYGTFKVSEPVVVLIDKGSASAAEIFAAGIKESNRGEVVGEVSFGKGTAQTIRSLSDTTGIKITYSKWLTPNGNWIHQKGVEPTLAVSLPSYANLAYINTQFVPVANEESDTILNLQKVLQALDYSVLLTGVYDEQTTNAIRTFNSAQGVSGDAFSASTAQALNRVLREKINANDTQLQEALKVLGQ